MIIAPPIALPPAPPDRRRGSSYLGFMFTGVSDAATYEIVCGNNAGDYWGIESEHFPWPGYVTLSIDDGPAIDWAEYATKRGEIRVFDPPLGHFAQPLRFTFHGVKNEHIHFMLWFRKSAIWAQEIRQPPRVRTSLDDISTAEWTPVALLPAPKGGG